MRLSAHVKVHTTRKWWSLDSHPDLSHSAALRLFTTLPQPLCTPQYEYVFIYFPIFKIITQFSELLPLWIYSFIQQTVIKERLWVRAQSRLRGYSSEERA